MHEELVKVTNELYTVSNTLCLLQIDLSHLISSLGPSKVLFPLCLSDILFHVPPFFVCFYYLLYLFVQSKTIFLFKSYAQVNTTNKAGTILLLVTVAMLAISLSGGVVLNTCLVVVVVRIKMVVIDYKGEKELGSCKWWHGTLRFFPSWTVSGLKSLQHLATPSALLQFRVHVTSCQWNTCLPQHTAVSFIRLCLHNFEELRKNNKQIT